VPQHTSLLIALFGPQYYNLNLFLLAKNPESVLEDVWFLLLIYHLDINECITGHLCQQNCNNTEGSYQCYCNSTYTANGTRCIGQ